MKNQRRNAMYNMELNMILQTKSQVWVETMIYLLIGIAVITAVLAFALPKINEMKDKTIVDQSINMLNQLDAKIVEVQETGQGNVRNVELQMTNGEIILDYYADTITYELEQSKYQYSEPNQVVEIDKIKVLTTPLTEDTYRISAMLNYSLSTNLTDYKNSLSPIKLVKAPTPYKLEIRNNDTETSDNRYRVFITIK